MFHHRNRFPVTTHCLPIKETNRRPPRGNEETPRSTTDTKNHNKRPAWEACERNSQMKSSLESIVCCSCSLWVACEVIWLLLDYQWSLYKQTVPFASLHLLPFPFSLNESTNRICSQSQRYILYSGVIIVLVAFSQTLLSNKLSQTHYSHFHKPNDSEWTHNTRSPFNMEGRSTVASRTMDFSMSHRKSWLVETIDSRGEVRDYHA